MRTRRPHRGPPSPLPPACRLPPLPLFFAGLHVGCGTPWHIALAGPNCGPGVSSIAASSCAVPWPSCPAGGLPAAGQLRPTRPLLRQPAVTHYRPAGGRACAAICNGVEKHRLVRWGGAVWGSGEVGMARLEGRGAHHTNCCCCCCCCCCWRLHALVTMKRYSTPPGGPDGQGKRGEGH